MKKRGLLLAAACLFAVGCGNFRDRSILSSGHWSVERMELGGQPKTTEPFEMAFSPHGNSVVITIFNRTPQGVNEVDKVHKGVYELQSDKDPKEIDIKPDASNLEDKQMYGIYAIDADGQGLLLCLSPTKRPKKFETSPSSDQVLIKLRKQP
jgi:uncharacterized protein (TIGR03067 family)